MSAPWPPPPDLASIQELVATADVEGFLAEGSPMDEYETEADQLFLAIQNFPTANLTSPILLPLLNQIWRHSFNLDDIALAQRQPALQSLAQQIARFFGPEATPQTR